MNLDELRICNIGSVIFLAIAFAQLSACYSPVEGCTDPESTNYAVDADNSCEDCCIYPILKLSIFHENADTTFKLNDTITNDLGQQISLLKYVYLLSDFEIKIEDEVYEVSDSISLNVDTGIEFTKDDVIRVTRSLFTFELGTAIFDGDIDEISFRIGLSDLLNENRFTVEVDEHALTNDPDSLFQSDAGTYVFQRLQVAQGVDFLDTVIYDIKTAVEVAFPILDFESIRGADKTIIIEAQYDRWFDGIEFDLMDKTDIEAKIGQNSSNVFRQKN